MARNKALQSNIDNTSPADYPNARIRDDSGSGDGTDVNESVYGDIHEFFAKAMRLYGITYNSLPDNTTNGYQYIQALQALATKNDFMLSMTTDGVLILPLKLNLIPVGEAFTCIASIDRTAETQIKGSLDASPVAKNIVFKGGDFKNGEYLRVVVTALGVDIVRLSDGDALDTIATDFGFLKAASQPQEDAGAINTVATTPLTNLTAFVERVNGASSVNFLASAIQNGLLSAADKIKIDAGNNERNYGTFSPFNIDTPSVGQNAPVTGNINQAQVTAVTTDGDIYTITFANAFDNTTYQIQLDVESLGTLESDNDIKPPIWKKINTTQIQIYLEQTNNSNQSLKIHVTGKQR